LGSSLMRMFQNYYSKGERIREYRESYKEEVELKRSEPLHGPLGVLEVSLRSLAERVSLGKSTVGRNRSQRVRTSRLCHFQQCCRGEESLVTVVDGLVCREDQAIDFSGVFLKDG
jgi:hypothetical protein